MGNSTIFVDGARKACCVSCCLESVSPDSRFKKNWIKWGHFSKSKEVLFRIVYQMYVGGSFILVRHGTYPKPSKSLVSFGQWFVFTSFGHNKILCFVEKEGANTLTGIFWKDLTMQDESKKFEHAESQDGLVYPKSPIIIFSWVQLSQLE